MMGKAIKAVLIILILLLGLVQLVPEDVEAQGELSVQIVFDDANEADVRPGSECKVIIHGRVISDELVRDVIVKLVASTDQGWPCAVDPTEIIVAPRSEEPFTITVTLTPETSIYTSTTLTVGGTIGYYPGTIMYNMPGITGTIGIRQYSQFMIQCSEPMKHVQPGAQETIKFTISNIGNGRELYNIEIIDFDELDEKGFTATLSVRQIEIAEKCNDSFEVKVTIPSGINVLGTHRIHLRVTPGNMEIDDAQVVTFTTYIKICEEHIVYTTEFQVIIVIIVALIIASVFFIRWRRKKRKLETANNKEI